MNNISRTTTGLTSLITHILNNELGQQTATELSYNDMFIKMLT
jgi:hypothetical protein